MKLTYRHTLIASYVGYITQAIISSLPPLLFATFHREFGISLEKIGLLVSVNFVTQILVDLLSVKFADKIGYRVLAVAAHTFAAAGLVLFAVLPGALPNPYAGLVIAMVLSAIGGGLTEVLISPIVESLPGDEKARAMSLLHSFYCWGCVAVVLGSSGFFAVFGVENWRYLAFFWALIPFLNQFLFAKVPLRVLVEDGEKMPVRALTSRGGFWLIVVMMTCAGASELSVSQWASMFAETGLGISKAAGDLLGPCAFAVLMGLGRLLYGLFGGKLRISRWIAGSAALCVASYLITTLSPWPGLSLFGCALTGLSVALLWPGTLSLASARFPRGGTAMFALLALAGDAGCAAGPWIVGMVAGGAGTSGIRTGLLCAIAFPILLMAASLARLRGAERADGKE